MEKFNKLPDTVKNQLTGFKDNMELYRNTNPKDENEIVYFDTKKNDIVGLFIEDFGFIPNSDYFNLLRYVGFDTEDEIEEFFGSVISPLVGLKEYYDNRKVRLVGSKDTFDKYRKRFNSNTEKGYNIKI